MQSTLLKGKVAHITGATKGIGYATAREFARNGAKVVLSGRNTDGRLDDTVSSIENEFGSNAMGIVCDVGNPSEVQACYQSIFKTHKRLDILVNNAGILRDALIGMISEQTIEETFRTNTFGTILNIQLASRLMKRNSYGSIVNVSSIVGLNGNEGQTVYAATKAAIVGVTRSAAKELAPNNIRVNAVAPGFIETDMIKQLPTESYESLKDSIKMGRVGDPSDVANVIMFLASDLASYVTGQIVGVDGGMLI